MIPSKLQKSVYPSDFESWLYQDRFKIKIELILADPQMIV